ncbi:hypothetical protein BLNAU_412 [Blattamonas nauphoetae]|uniref:Uncharacterized protein n=1 Tax=Blattamonas nauphoetae TaxID=2049346 RepID=A0ABQ9YL63_9EUKA|nr:hypothetical protein BLNAU_412 [Blattamonas nauphoetae]
MTLVDYQQNTIQELYIRYGEIVVLSYGTNLTKLILSSEQQPVCRFLTKDTFTKQSSTFFRRFGRFCWEIVPNLSFEQLDNYFTKMRNGTHSERTFCNREHTTNNNIESRSSGLPVRYGDVICLRSVLSNQYLTLINTSEGSLGCLSNGEAYSTLTVIPQALYRKRGDPVMCSDMISLLSIRLDLQLTPDLSQPIDRILFTQNAGSNIDSVGIIGTSAPTGWTIARFGSSLFTPFQSQFSLESQYSAKLSSQTNTMNRNSGVIPSSDRLISGVPLHITELNEYSSLSAFSPLSFASDSEIIPPRIVQESSLDSEINSDGKNKTTPSISSPAIYSTVPVIRSVPTTSLFLSDVPPFISTSIPPSPVLPPSSIALSFLTDNVNVNELWEIDIFYPKQFDSSTFFAQLPSIGNSLRWGQPFCLRHSLTGLYLAMDPQDFEALLLSNSGKKIPEITYNYPQKDEYIYGLEDMNKSADSLIVPKQHAQNSPESDDTHHDNQHEDPHESPESKSPVHERSIISPRFILAPEPPIPHCLFTVLSNSPSCLASEQLEQRHTALLYHVATKCEVVPITAFKLGEDQAKFTEYQEQLKADLEQPNTATSPYSFSDTHSAISATKSKRMLRRSPSMGSLKSPSVSLKKSMSGTMSMMSKSSYSSMNSLEEQIWGGDSGSQQPIEPYRNAKTLHFHPPHSSFVTRHSSQIPTFPFVSDEVELSIQSSLYHDLLLITQPNNGWMLKREPISSSYFISTLLSTCGTIQDDYFLCERFFSTPEFFSTSLAEDSRQATRTINKVTNAIGLFLSNISPELIPQHSLVYLSLLTFIHNFNALPTIFTKDVEGEVQITNMNRMQNAISSAGLLQLCIRILTLTRTMSEWVTSREKAVETTPKSQAKSEGRVDGVMKAVSLFKSNTEKTKTTETLAHLDRVRNAIQSLTTSSLFILSLVSFGNHSVSVTLAKHTDFILSFLPDCELHTVCLLFSIFSSNPSMAETIDEKVIASLIAYALRIKLSTNAEEDKPAVEAPISVKAPITDDESDEENKQVVQRDQPSAFQRFILKSSIGKGSLQQATSAMIEQTNQKLASQLQSIILVIKFFTSLCSFHPEAIVLFPFTKGFHSDDLFLPSGLPLTNYSITLLHRARRIPYKGLNTTPEDQSNVDAPTEKVSPRQHKPTASFTVSHAPKKSGTMASGVKKPAAPNPMSGQEDGTVFVRNQKMILKFLFNLRSRDDSTETQLLLNELHQAKETDSDPDSPPQSQSALSNVSMVPYQENTSLFHLVLLCSVVSHAPPPKNGTSFHTLQFKAVPPVPGALLHGRFTTDSNIFNQTTVTISLSVPSSGPKNILDFFQQKKQSNFTMDVLPSRGGFRQMGTGTGSRGSMALKSGRFSRHESDLLDPATQKKEKPIAYLSEYLVQSLELYSALCGNDSASAKNLIRKVFPTRSLIVIMNATEIPANVRIAALKLLRVMLIQGKSQSNLVIGNIYSVVKKEKPHYPTLSPAPSMTTLSPVMSPTIPNQSKQESRSTLQESPRRLVPQDEDPFGTPERKESPQEMIEVQSTPELQSGPKSPREPVVDAADTPNETTPNNTAFPSPESSPVGTSHNSLQLVKTQLPVNIPVALDLSTADAETDVPDEMILDAIVSWLCSYFFSLFSLFQNQTSSDDSSRGDGEGTLSRQPSKTNPQQLSRSPSRLLFRRKTFSHRSMTQTSPTFFSSIIANPVEINMYKSSGFSDSEFIQLLLEAVLSVLSLTLGNSYTFNSLSQFPRLFAILAMGKKAIKFEASLDSHETKEVTFYLESVQIVVEDIASLWEQEKASKIVNSFWNAFLQYVAPMVVDYVEKDSLISLIQDHSETQLSRLNTLQSVVPDDLLTFEDRETNRLQLERYLNRSHFYTLSQSLSRVKPYTDPNGMELAEYVAGLVSSLQNKMQQSASQAVLREREAIVFELNDILIEGNAGRHDNLQHILDETIQIQSQIPMYYMDLNGHDPPKLSLISLFTSTNIISFASKLSASLSYRSQYRPMHTLLHSFLLTALRGESLPDSAKPDSIANQIADDLCVVLFPRCKDPTNASPLLLRLLRVPSITKKVPIGCVQVVCRLLKKLTSHKLLQTPIICEILTCLCGTPDQPLVANQQLIMQTIIGCRPFEDALFPKKGEYSKETRTDNEIQEDVEWDVTVMVNETQGRSSLTQTDSSRNLVLKLIETVYQKRGEKQSRQMTTSEDPNNITTDRVFHKTQRDSPESANEGTFFWHVGEAAITTFCTYERNGYDQALNATFEDPSIQFSLCAIDLMCALCFGCSPDGRMFASSRLPLASLATVVAPPISSTLPITLVRAFYNSIIHIHLAYPMTALSLSQEKIALHSLASTVTQSLALATSAISALLGSGNVPPSFVKVLVDEVLEADPSLEHQQKKGKSDPTLQATHIKHKPVFNVLPFEEPVNLLGSEMKFLFPFYYPVKQEDDSDNKAIQMHYPKGRSDSMTGKQKQLSASKKKQMGQIISEDWMMVEGDEEYFQPPIPSLNIPSFSSLITSSITHHPDTKTDQPQSPSAAQTGKSPAQLSTQSSSPLSNGPPNVEAHKLPPDWMSLFYSMRTCVRQLSYLLFECFSPALRAMMVQVQQQLRATITVARLQYALNHSTEHNTQITVQDISKIHRLSFMTSAPFQDKIANTSFLTTNQLDLPSFLSPEGTYRFLSEQNVLPDTSTRPAQPYSIHLSTQPPRNIDGKLAFPLVLNELSIDRDVTSIITKYNLDSLLKQREEDADADVQTVSENQMFRYQQFSSDLLHFGNTLRAYEPFPELDEKQAGLNFNDSWNGLFQQVFSTIDGDVYEQAVHHFKQAIKVSPSQIPVTFTAFEKEFLVSPSNPDNFLHKYRSSDSSDLSTLTFGLPAPPLSLYQPLSPFSLLLSSESSPATRRSLQIMAILHIPLAGLSDILVTAGRMALSLNPYRPVLPREDVLDAHYQLHCQNHSILPDPASIFRPVIAVEPSEQTFLNEFVPSVNHIPNRLPTSFGILRGNVVDQYPIVSPLAQQSVFFTAQNFINKQSSERSINRLPPQLYSACSMLPLSTYTTTPLITALPLFFAETLSTVVHSSIVRHPVSRVNSSSSLKLVVEDFVQGSDRISLSWNGHLHSFTTKLRELSTSRVSPSDESLTMYQPRRTLTYDSSFDHSFANEPEIDMGEEYLTILRFSSCFNAVRKEERERDFRARLEAIADGPEEYDNHDEANPAPPGETVTLKQQNENSLINPDDSVVVHMGMINMEETESLDDEVEIDKEVGFSDVRMSHTGSCPWSSLDKTHNAYVHNILPEHIFSVLLLESNTTDEILKKWNIYSEYLQHDLRAKTEEENTIFLDRLASLAESSKKRISGSGMDGITKLVQQLPTFVVTKNNRVLSVLLASFTHVIANTKDPMENALLRLRLTQHGCMQNTMIQMASPVLNVSCRALQTVSMILGKDVDQPTNQQEITINEMNTEIQHACLALSLKLMSTGNWSFLPKLCEQINTIADDITKQVLLGNETRWMFGENLLSNKNENITEATSKISELDNEVSIRSFLQESLSIIVQLLSHHNHIAQAIFGGLYSDESQFKQDSRSGLPLTIEMDGINVPVLDGREGCQARLYDAQLRLISLGYGRYLEDKEQKTEDDNPINSELEPQQQSSFSVVPDRKINSETHLEPMKTSIRLLEEMSTSTSISFIPPRTFSFDLISSLISLISALLPPSQTSEWAKRIDIDQITLCTSTLISLISGPSLANQQHAISKGVVDLIEKVLTLRQEFVKPMIESAFTRITQLGAEQKKKGILNIIKNTATNVISIGKRTLGFGNKAMEGSGKSFDEKQSLVLREHYKLLKQTNLPLHINQIKDLELVKALRFASFQTVGIREFNVLDQFGFLIQSLLEGPMRRQTADIFIKHGMRKIIHKSVHHLHCLFTMATAQPTTESQYSTLIKQRSQQAGLSLLVADAYLHQFHFHCQSGDKIMTEYSKSCPKFIALLGHVELPRTYISHVDDGETEVITRTKQYFTKQPSHFTASNLNEVSEHDDQSNLTTHQLISQEAQNETNSTSVGVRHVQDVEDVELLYFERPKLSSKCNMSEIDAIIETSWEADEHTNRLINFQNKSLGKYDSLASLRRRNKNVFLRWLFHSRVEKAVRIFSMAWVVLAMFLLLFKDLAALFINPSVFEVLLRLTAFFEIVSSMYKLVYVLGRSALNRAYERKRAYTIHKQKDNRDWSMSQQPTWKQILLWTYCMMHPSIIYALFQVFVSLFGFVNVNMLCLLAIDFIKDMKIVKTMMRALLNNLVFLFMSLVLLVVLLAVFSGFLTGFYQNRLVEDAVSLCSSYDVCFRHIVWATPANGQALPDWMRMNDILDVLVITVYYAVIGCIVMNLLLAIITDSLSDLHERQALAAEIRKQNCLICGLSRFELDKYGSGFDIHIRSEHNPHEYFHFITYLQEIQSSPGNSDNKLSGTESLLLLKVMNQSRSVSSNTFPIGHSYYRTIRAEQTHMAEMHAALSVKNPKGKQSIAEKRKREKKKHTLLSALNTVKALSLKIQSVNSQLNDINTSLVSDHQTIHALENSLPQKSLLALTKAKKHPLKTHR